MVWLNEDENDQDWDLKQHSEKHQHHDYHFWVIDYTWFGY